MNTTRRILPASFLLSLGLSLTAHVLLVACLMHKSLTNHTQKKPISISINTNSPAKTSNPLKHKVTNTKTPQTVTTTNPTKLEPHQTQGIQENTQEQIQFHFISQLTLPTEVLGQHFFPRTYRALFQYAPQITFIKLEPVSTPMNYLDHIVQNAFIEKLKSIPVKQLNDFITNQALYPSSQTHVDKKTNVVTLTLTFEEQ